MDDAEEGYMKVEKGDTRSFGQPHSSEDEGKGDVVMLYYPLFWWMMQRSVQEDERGYTRSCGTTSFYSR